jgi:aspartyl protease family protein
MRHLAGLAALVSGVAAAQSVTLGGSMGDKALLVVDGTPRTVAVGATFQNIKVVSVSGQDAVIELGGKRVTLVLGGAPVNVGGAPARAGSAAAGRPAATRIVMSAGSGGHYFTEGTINGRPVRFVVDTGATFVSLAQSEADRIGLDYKKGRRGMTATANGAVPTYVVTLDSVRVGDVTVYGVEAMVVPAQMDIVLLGNSFLNRFQMTSENDQMTLERRR